LSVFLNTEGTFHEIKSDITDYDQTGVVIYKSYQGPEILVGHSNFESSEKEASFIQGYRLKGDTLIPTRRIETNFSSLGALSMGDIDSDGDLDLFAGGRTIPGRYPEAASSILFINDENSFRPDIESRDLFEDIGLVTGALFTDIDSDNDPDLLLAMEWGPVTLFENFNGQFKNVTSQYGLDNYVGWWNGVTTGDFNEDGKLDIVATNWGLNTKYHANDEHPLTLYYDDFDRNGTLDIVEGHWDKDMGMIVPERGLSCLSTGIPYVKTRKPTYADFGDAGLQSILGHRLKDANKLEVKTLEHSLFLSDKNENKFQRFDLPVEAQLSPSFTATVTDMDGDGHEDLFLSQNFFSYQIETSRSDAGRGLWLRGDGTGNLTPVPGHESGVLVYGEQRGAAVADYDGDGRVDLIVTQNGAKTKLYRNVTAKPGMTIKNSQGQFRVKYANGSFGPMREINTGSGYWSQNGNSIIGLKDGFISIENKALDVENKIKISKIK